MTLHVALGPQCQKLAGLRRTGGGPCQRALGIGGKRIQIKRCMAPRFHLRNQGGGPDQTRGCRCIGLVNESRQCDIQAPQPSLALTGLQRGQQFGGGHDASCCIGPEGGASIDSMPSISARGAEITHAP